MEGLLVTEKSRLCRESKKALAVNKNLLVVKEKCGLTTAQQTQVGHSNAEWQQQFSTYSVELQMPYHICAEVLKKGVFYGKH